MSQVLINQYLAELSRLRKVSGEAREGIVSEAFKDLLKGWGRQHDLVFIPQYRLDSLTRDKRYVYGALLHELRVPFGCWEAKDSDDNLGGDVCANPELSGTRHNVFGIPPQAWGYRLGNRCALEWMLDQYKEKTPRDPTIREHFDTYRFADYKERVIDLLARVTSVSVETMRIVDAMRAARG